MNFHLHRWRSSLSFWQGWWCCSSPPQYAWKFFGARVWKFAFKHFPQPLRSHTQSFETLDPRDISGSIEVNRGYRGYRGPSGSIWVFRVNLVQLGVNKGQLVNTGEVLSSRALKPFSKYSKDGRRPQRKTTSREEDIKEDDIKEDDFE